MKYKITSKRKIQRAVTALIPTYASVPQARRGEQETEQILLDSLFEFAALGEAPAKEKIRLSSAHKLRSVLRRIAIKFEKSQKRPITFWAKALGAVLGVETAIALIAALVFFGRFIIPHDTLSVPSFVGADVRELHDTDEYELIISYKNHDELAAGTVISQTPSPDTERKLFWGKGPCRIFLSVSAGKHFYDIPDLTGQSRRDALLTLKTSNIPVKIVTQYSDSVKAGYVIDTVPPADQRLYDGEVLTLKVSLGAYVRTVYVPSLFGMSESEATSAISSAGLTLGKITYQSSDIPAGKVISQQYTPFSKIRSGVSVDITVSLGNSFVQKHVPDLYGLTVEEAAEELRRVGLVIGNIYSVASGAPSGTVISQSPEPSTPITSNITSVDIYVSS